MGKNDNYWLNPKTRRAQCLEMAIRHADAVGVHYDADDIIEHADAFGDYILTGEVAAEAHGEDKPAAAADMGVLTARIIDGGFGISEAMLRPATASETETEKREIEEKLAAAKQLGLRLVCVNVIDAKPTAEWHFKGPDTRFLRLIVKTAAEDISSKIGKVFDAGFIIRAVHYDDAGFPCVSWQPVSAAA